MVMNREIKIGNRIVSNRSKPLVIAELGINHNGSIEEAKKIARSAALAGCECIKHQTHFIKDEMTEEAKNIFPPHDKRSIWEIMEECALSREEEIELKKYCENLGMIYISTPFSRSAADFLDDIDIPAFKIGSGECDNLLLIEHIAAKGKPVIMSTGMRDIQTLQKSVEILESARIPYVLLECTNLYPSPPQNVSLGGILELKKAFPNSLIGFSDHSIGPSMAIAAIALGSCIIERHFTDTRYRKGPDIICSMDPAELSYLITRSEEIHTSLYNKKERTVEEESIYKFARGTLVADKSLKKGHVMTKDDIWGRRPGSGQIAANQYEKVIGKRLKINIKRNTQLKMEYFE